VQAQAQFDYYRALCDYNKALAEVHYRKGSLLDYNNVFLAEGPWTEKAYWDALGRARERDASYYFNYGWTRPKVMSQGPIPQHIDDAPPVITGEQAAPYEEIPTPAPTPAPAESPAPETGPVTGQPGALPLVGPSVAKTSGGDLAPVASRPPAAASPSQPPTVARAAAEDDGLPVNQLRLAAYETEASNSLRRQSAVSSTPDAAKAKDRKQPALRR
jgi:hypothetical protein